MCILQRKINVNEYIYNVAQQVGTSKNIHTRNRRDNKKCLFEPKKKSYLIVLIITLLHIHKISNNT